MAGNYPNPEVSSMQVVKAQHGFPAGTVLVGHLALFLLNSGHLEELSDLSCRCKDVRNSVVQASGLVANRPVTNPGSSTLAKLCNMPTSIFLSGKWAFMQACERMLVAC